jgi:hypothetical protein
LFIGAKMFGFTKKSKPAATPPTRFRIIERELASLTLSDWQQDAALCSQSRNVLSSPLVRQMLSVLHNSHPAFHVITGDYAARALHQARCEGYTMALADFESMGRHTPPSQPIPAEFTDEHITDAEAAEYGSTGTKTA